MDNDNKTLIIQPNEVLNYNLFNLFEYYAHTPERFSKIVEPFLNDQLFNSYNWEFPNTNRNEGTPPLPDDNRERRHAATQIISVYNLLFGIDENFLISDHEQRNKYKNLLLEREKAVKAATELNVILPNSSDVKELVQKANDYTNEIEMMQICSTKMLTLKGMYEQIIKEIQANNMQAFQVKLNFIKQKKFERINITQTIDKQYFVKRIEYYKNRRWKIKFSIGNPDEWKPFSSKYKIKFANECAEFLIYQDLVKLTNGQLKTNEETSSKNELLKLLDHTKPTKEKIIHFQDILSSANDWVGYEKEIIKYFDSGKIYKTPLDQLLPELSLYTPDENGRISLLKYILGEPKKYLAKNAMTPRGFNKIVELSKIYAFLFNTDKWETIYTYIKEIRNQK